MSLSKYTINMKLIKLTPRGYCKGVVNAINIAKKSRNEYPHENIYILGMIVHNRYVSEALKTLNIITLGAKGKSRLELLDEIETGVVIFTAHGVSQSVKDYARQKNLITIDASCVDVLKTQANVSNKIKEGYSVLYVGKNNHPEAMSIVDGRPNVYLISDLTSLNQLPKDLDKVYVTNQTTMSIIEISDIFNAIKLIYPDAEIEEEICNATRTRQQAIKKSDNIDLLYVVGDPKSNNTNKLKEIANSQGVKKVKMIETAKEIQVSDFNDVEIVGVTSGASTPTYLSQQVIEVIETYIKEKSLPEVMININDLL